MTLSTNLAFLAAAVKGTDAPPPADPLGLPRFAHAHAVSTILDACLEGSPLRQGLPDEVLAFLRDARLRQADRSARLLLALGRIARALREAHVPCIALKGLGQGARYFGGVDRRGTFDLDLLVAETDLPAAERVLGDLGFRRTSILLSRRLALLVTHSFDYEGDGIRVDLHWTLARHPSYRFDLGGLRGRREALTIGALTVDVPCDEDALALSILTVFRDFQRGALRARAFVDVYRILAACPDLDWNAFLARRRAEGTYRIAVNVLALLLHAFELRGSFPAVAAAVDSAGKDVRVGATTHLRLLEPGRLALFNRFLAIRLYDASPVRSLLWWLASAPVRVLAYRSWRLPGRRGPR